MQNAVRIPEIAQRDRFLRRVASQRKAFVVAGDAGLASVAGEPGRDVTLLWSSRSEAERWADVLAENPRVEELSLARLHADVLPQLAQGQRLIGPDWSADPIESTVDPAEVMERLRGLALDAFASIVRTTGQVLLLGDEEGPALTKSAAHPEVSVLPCWALEEEAAAQIAGPWSKMKVTPRGVEEFVLDTLPWLAERGWLVSPEHGTSAGILELDPDALFQQLTRE